MPCRAGKRGRWRAPHNPLARVFFRVTLRLSRDLMRLVIIESPYAGDIEANVVSARACVRDSLSRGEAPIASHLLYRVRLRASLRRLP